MRWMLLLVLVTGCMVGEFTEDDDADDGLRRGMGLAGGAPIKAVKWWNPLVDKEASGSFGLELPRDITYPEAIKKLCNQGVEAVFIRKGEPKIMRHDPQTPNDPPQKLPCDDIASDATCRKKINGKIADALVALRDNTTCDKKPVVYIMQRQQLLTDAQIEEYAGTELKELLQELAARDVKKLVKGIALVESHLGDACAVKNRAVDVARRINHHNNNWLEGKSLFIGGAGLGAKFRTINNPQACPRTLPETLRELSKQTASFSFIYKHFDNDMVPTCPDWDRIKNKDITRAEAKKYLLDGCPGLTDLVDGLERNLAEFPAHANVTFWGDEGDGVTNIPRGVMQALHEIFVTDRASNNFKHVVFDRLFDGAPAQDCSDEDHCKHLISIDSSKTAHHNTAQMKLLSTNVFETWNGWQDTATVY